MSSTFSLLVSRGRSWNAMHMRKVLSVWALAALYSCLCGSRNARASTQDLDGEIATLGKSIDETTQDVNLAFQRLKDETNATKSVLIVGGILTAHQGDTIQWPISLVPGTFSSSGLSFDLVIPAGLTFVSAAIGPAGVLAGKQLQFSTASGKPIVLLAAINQTLIGPGIVVIVTLKVDTTAIRKQYPIALNNPVVSDGAGNAVVNSTVSGTVIVQ